MGVWHVFVYTFVPRNEEARAQHWVSLSLIFRLILWDRVSSWTQGSVAGCLVSDLAISTLQCYDYRQASVCLVFIWVLGNMASHFAQQAPFLVDLFPQLPMLNLSTCLVTSYCFYYFCMYPVGFILLSAKWFKYDNKQCKIMLIIIWRLL